MLKSRWFLPLFILLPAFLYAETSISDSNSAISESTATGITVDQRVSIARAATDYPVTPGDIYTLTFQRSTDISQFQFTVDNDYRLNMGFLGTVDVEDLTFIELRDQVIRIVEEAYPRSFPQFEISAVATFEVQLSGEITASKMQIVRGPQRLDSVIQPFLTDYSSMRNVTLRRRSGRTMTVDLFRAERYADRSQNPYLQPGDTIIVAHRDRLVTISGAVERPGSYQLLAGENLNSVIESYASGFTPTADTERIMIRSVIDDGEARFVDYRERGERRTVVRDLDEVVVVDRTESFPIVYIEGAVSGDYIRRPLLEGETLLDVLKSIKNEILPVANLRDGRILQSGEMEPIPVDMEALLYGNDLTLDRPMEPENRVVIPYGRFQVFVTGEVTNAGYSDVSSLERLSQIVEPYLTDYSSIRDVLVRSVTGEEVSYDLFRARRFGERDQDPYLQPGDTVTLIPRDRLVTISGEVKRPGSYQLLEGEELDSLIELYAGGFTPTADTNRVSITSLNEVESATEPIFITRKYQLSETPARTISLSDSDVIRISSRTDYLPVVFFEGAVLGPGGRDDTAVSADQASNLNASDKFIYQFTVGETVADATRAIRNRFLRTSDLSNAILEREDGRRIAVNLNEILFSEELPSSVPLQRNDRIIIPFRQYFVTVSGAVALPGQYPYIPNRTYEYYLGLAGGVDSNRNWGKNPRITSIEGIRRSDESLIEPEDDIFFTANNPMFHLMPVLTFLSTIISSVLLVQNLTN